ncbi:MAG: CbtA family protein [Dongiaceae bacterium]
MTIFRNAVFLAALAGLLAGIVMTGLQTAFTVPLILEAETFENAAPAHDHDAAAIDSTETAVVAAEHEHDEEAWGPEDGAERTLFTAAVNIVTGIGFALLLVVASTFAGGMSGWRAGLIWGFAGFAVFTLAPGLGLPPELPAMPAADLAARQTWWIFAVVATAAGLALIAFRRSLWLAVLGVALLVLPHFVGAPQPDSYESPIPADLHHRFVVAVTITNLVFWVVLGAAVGGLRQRFASGLTAPQQSLA